MQWFALIVPFLLSIFYKLKYSHSVTFKEFAISLLSIILTIQICIWIYGSSLGQDEKIISGWVVGKQHIPAHSETRTGITTDGEGNTSIYTYTVYIPDDFSIYLGYNKTKDNTKKPASHGGEMIGEYGYTKNCDKNKYEKANLDEPAVWEESFRNPLKLSRSNLYKQFKNKMYPLPPKPCVFDIYDMNRIICFQTNDISKEFYQKLNFANSMLNQYTINIGFIITTLPNDYGQYLENIWRGGNPNDFVIVFNIDSNNIIQNVKIISWDNEYLKIKVKDTILNNITSIHELDKVINIVYDTIKAIGFKEEDFTKFRYIRIQFPTSFLIFLYIFSITITIGILEFCRRNEN